MLIIDVREPDEYAQSHVNGAVNIPLGQIAQSPDLLDHNAKSENIVVYCNSGSRSEMARQQLIQLGYANVVNGVNQVSVEANLG